MNTNEPIRGGGPGHAQAGRMRLRCTLLGIAIFAFGLLIWSRLLLVTNYPKTAIAEPAAQSSRSRAIDAEVATGTRRR